MLLLDWRRHKLDSQTVWGLYRSANRCCTLKQTMLELNVSMIERDFHTKRIPLAEYEYRIDRAMKHKYRRPIKGSYFVESF